jgi:pSer/pThr/pTyr-binding forkhead associated (FHA) protein
MFKYECRGCPVQAQCIDKSDLVPAARETIRNMFVARTDTRSTWRSLQKNCLLAEEDRERERNTQINSLHQRAGRESQAGQTALPADDDQARDSVVIGRSPIISTSELSDAFPASSTTNPLTDTPAPGTIRFDPKAFRTRSLETPPGQVAPPTAPCWLVIRYSQRRISLPINGELLLGRFDPNVIDPLDIDLTFEDQNKLTISRRHGRIVGVGGRHTLEDLGSSNGSSINGTLMEPGRVYPLQPGDRVMLGGVLLEYETVPADLFSILSTKADDVRHLLYLTHAGRRIEIAAPNNLTIGRADPDSNFVPSLDLSRDGDVSTYVSRRHGIITWNRNSPYFKDLQSTFGTRLNGEALPPNEAISLQPGDHLSLGGYVLAYDVEV